VEGIDNAIKEATEKSKEVDKTKMGIHN